MALHLGGVKEGQQRIHQGLRLYRMIGTEIAHVHIQRDGVLLGLGVHAQVRLGQQHRGSDTARALGCGREGVKQLVHRLQTRSAHGIRTGQGQCGGIQHALGSAAAATQIGSEMQSLHGQHCSALAATRRRARVPASPPAGRTGKMPGFP